MIRAYAKCTVRAPGMGREYEGSLRQLKLASDGRACGHVHRRVRAPFLLGLVPGHRGRRTPRAASGTRPSGISPRRRRWRGTREWRLHVHGDRNSNVLSKRPMSLKKLVFAYHTLP